MFGACVPWVLASNRFPDDGIVIQLLTMLWIVGAMVAATGTLWHGWSTEEALNGGMALSKERGGDFSFVGVVLAATAVFLLWPASFIHVLPTGPPASLRRMQG